MDGLSAGLTAATNAAAGYQKRQLQAAILGRQLQDEDDSRQMQHAELSARMRQQGFIPDAERGPNEQTLMSGPQTGQLMAAISGGPIGVGIGVPDAKAPRYGASVGGFSYDNAGQDARQKGAKLDETMAQTKWLQARPDIAARTLDVRQTEGAANRDSRASQTADRLAAQQTIAANHDAIRLRVHNDSVNPDGSPKPVTGTALLGVTARLSREYAKPTYAGGLGLSRQDALRQAMADARQMAGAAPTPPPASPASGRPNVFSQYTSPALPGLSTGSDAASAAPSGGALIQRQQGAAPVGNVDLSQPSPRQGPSGVRHPIEVAGDAEQMIRNGKATLDQALNSPYLSDPVKAVLRQRFAKP